MTKLLYSSLVCFVILSCRDSGRDKAEVSQAKEIATPSALAVSYSLDLNKSIVTWIGSKPAGRHNGTINLSSGHLSLEGDAVSAGEFIMDMSTVQAHDEAIDAEKNAQLTDHLRSSDFFDVANYPAASFDIVSVKPISEVASGEEMKLAGATHYITGNLTMKDSTKAVTFPAVILVSDTALTAHALFYIDRTDWGMHYKSDKSFGNQIIQPRVEVGFSIVANRDNPGN